MTDLPIASSVVRGGINPPARHRVVLTYDQRFLRRRRLESEAGLGFLVDLAETVSLQEGDTLLLSDGSAVAVVAAAEPVLRVKGDLSRLAWHIGNRHTPCQFDGDALVIRDDHVLAAMLRQLGAQVVRAEAPFAPEGGAYGHGRTLGHDHGPQDHGHEHSHAHHDHHDHDHAHHHHHAEEEREFGQTRRASPVNWMGRQPGTAPQVEHELPAHGPFDDET